MNETPFKVKKLAVLGLGMIGGSVASAAKARSVAEKIVGYDPYTGARALNLGLVDEIAASPALAVQGADLVVIAAPPSKVIELALACVDQLDASALMTDVASTKGQICRDLADPESLEIRGRFVPAHPIAGGEHSGPEAARPSLFAGATVILTKTDWIDASQVERVSHFWQSLGAKTHFMGYQEHDRTYALVSHLPHWVAFALGACLARQEDGNELAQASGAGLRDTTRIAGSNPDLWVEIARENQLELVAGLDQFAAVLAELRDSAATGDWSKAHAILTQASQWRRSF